MAISRKDFFKKACLAGACFCGFTSLGMQATASAAVASQAQPDDMPRSVRAVSRARRNREAPRRAARSRGPPDTR